VVNTGASWLAQVFSTRPDMPSGPAAFLVFTLNRPHFTNKKKGTARAHQEIYKADYLNLGMSTHSL